MNMETPSRIHMSHQLCPELKTSELCFRSHGYRNGAISETMHEHIPAHRISQESAREAVRALAEHSAGWPAVFMLHSRLNNTSGGPPRYPTFVTNVSYPEEGVVRYTISSGDGWAWFNKVINLQDFRRSTDHIYDRDRS